MHRSQCGQLSLRSPFPTLYNHYDNSNHENSYEQYQRWFVQNDILLKEEKYRQSYGKSNQQQNSYKFTRKCIYLLYSLLL